MPIGYASSSSSTSSRGNGPHRRGGKTVMAEVPVTLGPRTLSSREKERAPQDRLDDFWSKFNTKTPGKATAVLPRKSYASSKKAPPHVIGGGLPIHTSYEDAAQHCRAKVAQIVKECRRVNQRYRDPHFDLELDFQLGLQDCLESLDNTRDSHSGARLRDVGGKGQGRGPSAGGDEGKDGAADAAADAGDADAGQGGRRRRVGPPPPFIAGFNPKAVKRVVDIFDSPQLYIDGPTANDIRQGRDVGDCWLMAALCTMSNKPGLIERICIDYDQNVGVYGFVFHRDGEWFSEIIDDKLYLSKPDYDDGMLERILWDDRERTNTEEAYRKIYQSNSGALYFAQCENPNETWLPLLEKAYAKAHGDYEAIEGGYTGEGIEDLTGGVTSEIYTTDILDREHFWKEELMRVNRDFLFGCSTGVWGRGVGERRGIVELHAYSVMKAVEIDGTRLVLLKNPWGKHEWKGPWSDGSKEWTPEWLSRLEHRFGDDGVFWISYQDLLRKYQAFDRTRLFGPEWKVASIWTTMSVPWTVEYHDTKFAFSLSRKGPVVLVLSQLDDRYFQGLQGQYRFELAFRLHVAGDADGYIVRSQAPYRMNRSVNVELDLDAGEYTVLVKIDAVRDTRVMPPEDVVRANAKTRREKLARIGLAYDLAHSKGRIIETPEEKGARLAADKRKRDKEKRELKDSITVRSRMAHYGRIKDLEKRRKEHAKAKAKMAAKEEKRTAKAAEKRAAGKGDKKDADGEKKEADEEKDRKDENLAIGGGAATKNDSTSPKQEAAEATSEDPKDAANEQGTTNDATDTTETDAVKEQKGSDSTLTTPVANTPATSTSGALTADQTQDQRTDDQQAGKGDKPEQQPTLSKAEETISSSEAEKNEDAQKQPDAGSEPKPSKGSAEKQAPEITLDPGATHTQEKPSSSTAGAKLGEAAAVPQARLADAATQAPEYSDEESVHRPPRLRVRVEEQDPGRGRMGRSKSPPTPDYVPYLGGQTNRQSRHQRIPPPGGIQIERRVPVRVVQQMPPGWRGPWPPRRVAGSDAGSETGQDDYDDDDGLSSISSMSDVTDRELELTLEGRRANATTPGGVPPGPPRPIGPPPPGAATFGDDADQDKDPWNAVAVVGLRVYYKLAEGEQKDAEIVKLRVERPNTWLADETEEDAGAAKYEDSGQGQIKAEKDRQVVEEKTVLDVDDSARDAALQIAIGEDQSSSEVVAVAGDAAQGEQSRVDEKNAEKPGVENGKTEDTVAHSSGGNEGGKEDENKDDGATNTPAATGEEKSTELTKQHSGREDSQAPEAKEQD